MINVVAEALLCRSEDEAYVSFILGDPDMHEGRVLGTAFLQRGFLLTDEDPCGESSSSGYLCIVFLVSLRPFVRMFMLI